MATRTIRVSGPRALGTTVSATLLRDLLAVVIEGSRKAVRIRTEGRSSAPGAAPRWLEAASDFTVELRSGSTEVVLEAPTLREANPEGFDRAGSFPELDPQRTSFDYLVDSLAAVLRGGEGSERYDRSLLQSFQKLGGVFASGARTVRLEGATEVCVRPEHVSCFERLEERIPPSRYARVAGTLDLIRHSDHTFTLVLPGSGVGVRGLAETVEPRRLQELWGQRVLVVGSAHFAPGAGLLRIDAESVEPASDADAEIWGRLPEPLFGPGPVKELRRAQGPRSGLNAIWGRWPGAESDDEVLGALEAVS